MAEVRSIKASLLLILVLQFTAVTGQSVSSLTVREGHEVTLSCENLNDGQDKCDHISWIFADLSKSGVDLVTHGKIVEKAKSDRLSVTENCSLVIQKVTDEDGGQYECQKVNSNKQQNKDTLVLLSVINLQEHDDGEQVTLSCSVTRHRTVIHTLKWLYEGDNEVIKSYTNMQTPQSEGSVTVTFPTSNFTQKSKHLQLIKCEMTDGYSKKVQQFPFSPPQSSDKATTSTTTTTTTITDIESNKKSTINSTELAGNNTSTPEWWWFVIVALGSVALLVIIVAVIRCKRTKGNKKQTDDDTGQSLNPAVTQPGPDTSQDTGDPEDGVSYASISYTKKTSSKAQVQVKIDDDEDDSVTYSTVKASSSSSSSSAAAGTSAEPSDLYATVNKPNK